MVAGKKSFFTKISLCIKVPNSKKHFACPLLILNITFVFGYYKSFTFVLSQKNYQLFYKDNSVNCGIYHTVNRRLMLMALDVFSNFRFNSDLTAVLFYRNKLNSHGVYVIKRKTIEEGFVQV